MTSLHDPHSSSTPSQRLAAAAHNARRAKIAARALPDRPIVLHKPMPVRAEPMPEPVFSMGDWVERQKKIPIPPIPKETWFSIVGDLGPIEPRKPMVEEIQFAVARYYGIPRADIISHRRTNRVVRPRQVAIYLARMLTLRTLPEIGRRFGGRDHTTCLFSYRKIERLAVSDQVLAQDIAAITALITEDET